MLYLKKLLGFSFLMVIFSASWSYAQNAPAPNIPAKTEVTVTGRLSVEKHGQEGQNEWLVLHAKDSATYLIKGALRGELKNALLELGENNLVSVLGEQDGSSAVVCERTTKPEDNQKGAKELKSTVKCVRYYTLSVTRVISKEKSQEVMPLPKTDSAEEEKVLKGGVATTPMILGQIYGKISAANLRAPIKTIEVTNRDQDNPLKEITLIITSDARIAKKIGKEDAVALNLEGLKADQEVTVIYTKQETESKALVITITKE